MGELPTGTVTLLFSDIEGSTVLLSRLGTEYAAALTGQRQMLRAAWAAHGGTELGTEGDSFFVVFPTAEGAVSAAVQAQRDLAGFPWPGGERVRVRMGIHTGAPVVCEGAYVGMDVHRAARIAGAAHGGQVLVSQTTGHLVEGCLPEGARLVDLGSHQLKDIPAPERLLQVTVAGMQNTFPPPKTLGTSTSLPRPATPLVGRDGELAELTALLRSSGVRLVTLTGPGGSGKTRLAIGVAQQLVAAFPDGVYFVPLAAVTTPDTMWTTIAGALDVPPEGRNPPGFFTHVAHRSALFVLDNLEQLPGADTVVAELLREASQVVVVATSRRPLHVAAEYEHPVPPLELPKGTSLAEAQASGAVQLFVQQARKVAPSFTLTAENIADVAEVCRRLDGLPLAIELAAARSKLLGPGALLARLDRALELKDTGVDRPTRQRTLRETIAWSYDLLTADTQVSFRRLGVFAGGADLDAIEAVTASDDDSGSGDALDLVAELVDASLVTVIDTVDTEPRFGLLEIVRAYAAEQLAASDEREAVRERHAHHYLAVVERMNPLLETDQRMEARTWYETEHDNLREALSWAFRPDKASQTSENVVETGLRLCAAVADFWFAAGYYSEARRWLERAIKRAGNRDSPELARCLQFKSAGLRISGDLDRAHEYATAGVHMCRRLGDPSRLAFALLTLAGIEAFRGQRSAARLLLEESLSVTRDSGDRLYPCPRARGSCHSRASRA